MLHWVLFCHTCYGLECQNIENYEVLTKLLKCEEKVISQTVDF